MSSQSSQSKSKSSKQPVYISDDSDSEIVPSQRVEHDVEEVESEKRQAPPSFKKPRKTASKAKETILEKETPVDDEEEEDEPVKVVAKTKKPRKPKAVDEEHDMDIIDSTVSTVSKPAKRSKATVKDDEEKVKPERKARVKAVEKSEKVKEKAPSARKKAATKAVAAEVEGDAEVEDGPEAEVEGKVKAKRHVMTPLERVDSIIKTLADVGHTTDVDVQLTRLRNQLDGAKIKSTTTKRAPNAFNLWMRNTMKEFADSDMKPKEKFAHCISLWNEKKAAGLIGGQELEVVQGAAPDEVVDEE